MSSLYPSQVTLSSCDPVPLHQTEPSLSLSVHFHCACPPIFSLSPSPPRSKMLQQKGEKTQRIPLYEVELRWIVSEFRAPLLLWHEITALGFCQRGCQLVNYNTGRQDWDKQKIQWQLLHRTILSGLVNTKIHCVNKDRQLHYAIVCYCVTAKEHVLILENRSRLFKLIWSCSWEAYCIKESNNLIYFLTLELNPYVNTV